MKFIKTTIAFIFLTIGWTVSAQQSYTFVIPNTPGSISDVVARSMATIYNKKTGNSLVIQNIGGGQQIPAAVKFSNLNTPAIAMTTTGILVFNPVMQKSLPYSLDMFDHVGGIAYTPIVWVVRADSSYTDMKNMVETLHKSKKPLIAYANLVEVVNYHVLASKYNWKNGIVDPVKYKGVPEVVQGLLAGDLDVAVVTNTQAVSTQIQSGRLRVIGTTLPKSFEVGGVTVTPVKNQIGVEQFTGGVFISLNTRFKPEEAAKLKSDLYGVMTDPDFITELRKFNVIPFDNNSSNTNLIKFTEDFRNAIKPLNLTVQ